VRSLHVHRLGVVPYADAVTLQRALVDDRKADRIPDTLLLLQHPHVLTLGVRRGGADHILAPPDRLAELGVEVFETGRGGDVTYHGPGQLVAYPILDLRPDRQDVHRYVRDLEEVMIRTCAACGVEAGRVPGLSGVWIDDEKIGAIGVRISRWVTSHGVAFNVTTDLGFFELIVPCGIADRGVTSLEQQIGVEPSIVQIEDLFVRHFGDVFERAAVEQPSGEQADAGIAAPWLMKS
jgi:lipoyl(octanoyl) transferase